MREEDFPVLGVDACDEPRHTYRLIQPLLYAFPELAADFHRGVREVEADDDGGYNLHTFFIDCLGDVLRRVLQGAESAARADALFSWMEKLASLGDQYVDFFLQTEMMELMGDDPQWVDYSRTRMGPASVRLFVESEEEIGRVTNLPLP